MAWPVVGSTTSIFGHWENSENCIRDIPTCEYVITFYKFFRQFTHNFLDFSTFARAILFFCQTKVRRVSRLFLIEPYGCPVLTRWHMGWFLGRNCRGVPLYYQYCPVLLRRLNWVLFFYNQSIHQEPNRIQWSVTRSILLITHSIHF